MFLVMLLLLISLLLLSLSLSLLLLLLTLLLILIIILPGCSERVYQLPNNYPLKANAKHHTLTESNNA